MQLVKTGNGKAKGFSDLAKVSISLVTTSKEKGGLLDKYLCDYDALKNTLKNFLDKYQVELSFDSYHMAEKMKTVEKIAISTTEKKSEIDYYYVRGEFTLELPIKDNDRRIVAEFIDCIEKVNDKVSYHINFTLSEKKASELRAEATNNALDNIKIEVIQIANHLDYHGIDLVSIDFTEDALDGNYRMRSAASIGTTERVQKLDEMLESKEIVVESSFISTWKIS